MTLKDVRKKTGLSQAEFAKTLGVSSSAVSNVECGLRKPSSNIKEAIKKVYGEVIDAGTAAAKPAEKKTKPAAKKAKPGSKKAKPAQKKEKSADAKAEPAEVKAAPVKAEAKKTKLAAKKGKPAAKKAKPSKEKAKSEDKKANPAEKIELASEVKTVVPEVKAEPAEVKEEPVKADAKPAEKKAEPESEAQPKKPKVVIQSPFGGEITPEEIFAKIDNAETVYVRVDVNKAYWVNGEEYGNVDLW